MNYSDINAATSKALQKQRQNSVFTNYWEDSGKLIASLAVSKEDLENANYDEDSFIAHSGLFPTLLKNINIDTLSLTDLVILSQTAKAIETGDSKAATFVRDTSGGKPKDDTKPTDKKLPDLTDAQIEYLLTHAKIE